MALPLRPSVPSSLTTDMALVYGSAGVAGVETHVKSLIAAAEDNVRRLTTQIHELTLARDRENAILIRLRRLVTPIAKLPEEVLVQIFKLVFATPRFHPHDDFMGRYGFNSTERTMYSDKTAAMRKTLGLARVSTVWRHVVASNPSLWTDCIVSVTMERTGESALEGLNRLLGRSAPYPVSLSLCCPKESALFHPPSVEILRSTAGRWRSVEMDFDSLHHLAGFGTTQFHSLERLRIYRGSYNQKQEDTDLFLDSPRLWHANIESDRPDRIRLPYSQLTVLELVADSARACRAVLLQCTNLVKAKICADHQWDGSPLAAASPLVTFPHLETLDLDLGEGLADDDVDSMDAFLSVLDAPALTKLVVCWDSVCNWSGSLWPTPAVSDFQRRSPKIASLDLQFCNIERDELLTFLRFAPCLTELRIRYSWNCVDDLLLEALRVGQQPPSGVPLVPRLTEIHWNC
ncbi:unnamed protein product, partial [Mycena citricolor]